MKPYSIYESASVRGSYYLVFSDPNMRTLYASKAEAEAVRDRILREAEVGRDYAQAKVNAIKAAIAQEQDGPAFMKAWNSRPTK